MFLGFLNGSYPSTNFKHKPKKKKKDTPLLTWKEYRGHYLDACLELEGRGRFRQPECAKLNCRSILTDRRVPPDANVSRTFRCLDCFGNGLYCQQCLVSDHLLNPLHRIEVREPCQIHRIILINYLVPRNGRHLSSDQYLFVIWVIVYN